MNAAEAKADARQGCQAVAILGDCLEVMPSLSPACVHMIYCDLPFGVLGHSWDTPVPLAPFWRAAARLRAPGAPLLAAGNEPFHLKLIEAWREHYRYGLIWDKGAPTSFLQARKRPMVAHEYIGVYGTTAVYNPQKTHGHPPYKKTISRMPSGFLAGYEHKGGGQRRDGDTTRFPRSILSFPRDRIRRRSASGGGENLLQHTSQKPQALLEWLIRSYTREGAWVLDPTAGSFSTGAAAIACGRNAICIERDREFFSRGVERLQASGHARLEVIA